MKKKIYRSIALLLCYVLVFNFFTVFANNVESDESLQNYCPYNEWAVEAGKENRIIFLEDIRENAKRYQVASLLSFLVDEKSNGISQNLEFTDINGLDKKYVDRIRYVCNKKIVSGYLDGTFKPYENITRAEFVTMLLRTNLIKQTNKTTIAFEDVDNHWAKEYIESISQTGIFSGKEANKFYPDAPITIQEIFVVLDRMCNKNIIKKGALISSLTETFKCKQYSDKEEYIIETMYSKYDEVLRNMKYYWYHNDYYDISVWQGYATYKDLIDFYFIANNQREGFDDDGKMYEHYYTVIERILGYDNLQSMLNRPILLKDVIKVLSNYALSLRTNDGNINWLKFKNLDEIDYSGAEDLLVAIKNYGLLENSNSYIPYNESKVSKYMLTYFFYNYFDKFNLLGDKWGFKNYPKEFKIKTNQVNLPSNYNQYTYIMENIPKEIYEKPFIFSNTNEINTPNECYEKYVKSYYYIARNAIEYYDTILNVDYSTMNIDKFVRDVQANTYRNVNKEEITKYAQYVIDNKIKLKGYGYAVPASVYISGLFAYVRIVIEVEVISADNNKNLLLGDFLSKEDVIYTKANYNLCFDQEIQGSYNFNSGDMYYELVISPIVRSINWDNLGKNEL